MKNTQTGFHVTEILMEKQEQHLFLWLLEQTLRGKKRLIETDNNVYNTKN